MEEKIKGESDVLIKKENIKAPEEVTGKDSFTPSECPQTKQEGVLGGSVNCMEDTKNGFITQKAENVIHSNEELLNAKNSGTAVVDQSANKKSEKKTRNKVLKRKLTEDGATIERVLSEGEASSGFETVSSIDSKVDIEDISLTSESDDYNIIVKVENDFVDRSNFSERKPFWRDRSFSPKKDNNQSGSYTGKYISQRYDSYRRYNQGKDINSQRVYDKRDYRYDRRGMQSRENDDYYEFRRKYSSYRDHSRNSDHSRRSWSRCSDQSRKSRESKCSDCSRRSKGSGNVHTSRFERSRSNERNRRARRSKTPTHKAKNIESRRSRSPEKLRSKFNRSPVFRKRRRSFSKSPPSSVWKRLGTSDRLRKDHNLLRNPNYRESRKKERTPFLIELERKLKEAKSQKNGPKEQNISVNEKTKGVNPDVATSALEPAAYQNSKTELSSNYTSAMQSVPGMYLQCAPIPTISVDNLPLVPGQTGLPVHISVSGEIIPHDMDGRRIPIGLNGYYLPLDPTGRLFPHIVSPDNQAVPIHMTEDGVLRLPNSEPVPYGPSHRFPVNIDGSVILMGPDSKPLVPCSNLPSQPPLYLFQNNISQNSAPVDFYPSNRQPPLIKNDLRVSHNFPTRRNKTESVNAYQKNFQERESDRVCKKIKTDSVTGSNEVKITSTKPTTPNKISNDEHYSDVDMVLDSNDSDSTNGSKLLSETKAGSKGSRVEPKWEDFIVKKIQQVIKSLSDSNFKPPTPGRLIISKVAIHPVKETSPNISPLLRNRVILPYITPNFENCQVEENEIIIEETENVSFSFLSGKSPEKGKNSIRCSGTFNRKTAATKLFPTSDFAVQCDLTAVIIKNLTSKVADMEGEVVRLRNINTNLLDGFRNIREASKKKGEELRKAMSEIEKKNNEISTLKGIIGEKERKKLGV